MKQCPLCKRYFDDENDFCLEDGTPLSVSSGANPFAGHNPTGDVPTEIITSVATPPQADLPTQVYQTPYGQPPQPAKEGSSGNILYLVIGVLATALVALGAYVLLVRETPKEREQTAANATQSSPAPSPTPQPTSVAQSNSNVAAPIPASAATTPPPSVEGQWSGDISYPSGSVFSASAQFTDTGAKGVKGQITWTIIKSFNREKQDKVGISATEYVEGSFDASGKVLSLRGVSKSDPSNIIILDRYRLTVSPDSRSFTGVSTGGKTPGRVVLRRN